MIRTARDMVATISRLKLIGMTDLIAHRQGRPVGASELSLTRQDS